MRKLFLVAVACAVILPSATAGTPAASMPSHSLACGPQAGSARPTIFDGPHGSARYVPLGARLSAGATVSGTIRDSQFTRLPGVEVEWDSPVGDTVYQGPGLTDANGAYSMTAVATTAGEIWAYPDADSAFARGGRTWTEGGSDTVNMVPGRAHVVAWQGGRWASHGSGLVTLRLFGTTQFSKGAFVPRTTPADGDVDVLDGDYDQGGSVMWFRNEGVEVAGISVTSGMTSYSTITVDEGSAQRVWVDAPYWGSGKPGVTVTLQRETYPSGWRNFVYGYTEDPRQTAYREFGTKVSQGGYLEPLKVQVPATAKPGYTYTIGLQHVAAGGGNLPLNLEAGYQVCTIKPSRTSITKGSRIRVSGVVPTQDHWGSQAGRRKKVILLWHQGTAAVPKNPTRQGWVAMSSTTASGTGAYTTAYVKPKATGTFVVYYPADDWYWAGFTSTARVAVH